MEIQVAAEGHGRFRAQGAFTDREPECEAFHAAILSHEENVWSGVLGYGRPRRNVLVFHGLAGIGKTTLSTTLQGWLNGANAPEPWGPPVAIDRPLRSVRMDLDSTEGFDAERLMLLIRAELSDTGCRFDAFDLGLGFFWDFAHPGQDFPAIRSSRGPGKLVGDQIHDSLTAILRDEVGLEGFGTAGAAVRGLRAMLKFISKRLSASRAGGCPDLRRIVEDMRREAELSRDDAVQLAPLLHWDLAQNSVPARPQLIVFLDGYERVREEGSVGARLLRALAYYLPEVLLVVTGRNRLRWDEEHDDHAPETVGGDCWPGLIEGATEEPRQHLVGELSEVDVAAFLSSFITQDDRPLLSKRVQRRIIAASGGLPLALDLAVDRAIDLHLRGAPIEVDSFARSREGVVRNVVRDLDEGNRKLLRVGALLPNWDVELLRDSTGIPGGRIKLGFLHRAFVHKDSPSALPYRVHDIIRASILAEDVSMGEWDREDWRIVAEHAMEALHERIDASTDPYEEAALLRTALEVCSRSGTEADWLRLAAFRFRSLRELAVTLPPPLADAPGAYGTKLHRLIGCYALPRHERHRALRVLAESGDLHPTLEIAAWRHYAYRMRSRGDGSEALSVFIDLSERFEQQRDLHTHQVALTLISMGRLADAWEHGSSVSKERRTAIAAAILWRHGRVGEAVSLLRQRVEQLRADGDKRVSGEQERLEAFFRGLLHPGAAVLADRCRREAEEMGNPSATVAAISAQMTARAGDQDAIERLLVEADRIVEAEDLPGTMRFVALGFHHAVRTDETGLREVEGRLSELKSGGRVDIYRRLVQFWLDDLAGGQSKRAPAFQWCEEEENVRGRWVALVRARRSLLGL